MALTPFDMEGVNRDLLAAGNPAKPDMRSSRRIGPRPGIAVRHDPVNRKTIWNKEKRI